MNNLIGLGLIFFMAPTFLQEGNAAPLFPALPSQEVNLDIKACSGVFVNQGEVIRDLRVLSQITRVEILSENEYDTKYSLNYTDGDFSKNVWQPYNVPASNGELNLDQVSFLSKWLRVGDHVAIRFSEQSNKENPELNGATIVGEVLTTASVEIRGHQFRRYDMPNGVITFKTDSGQILRIDMSFLHISHIRGNRFS